MRWCDLQLRLRALLFRRRAEDELDEELQFHLAMGARKNLASGMDAADASREVRLQFGGIDQVKEGCRDARGVDFVQTAFRDLRYALAGFRRKPGFALTVIATIALALGLNTALFTILNAYVFQPLKVRDPYRLYEFTWTERGGGEARFSWNRFQEFREENPAFAEVAAVDRLGLSRVEGHLMLGQLVTLNYFQMLGVGASLGRTIQPGDAAASLDEVVLSSSAWTNKFGRDPHVLGKRIVIHGHSLEVVGVAQPGFDGLGAVPLDFWTPLALAPQLEADADLFGPAQPERLTVIGRLRPGITLNRARSSLSAWAMLHTAQSAEPRRAAQALLRSRATMLALDPAVVAAFIPVLLAFGLVLVIACANVANMMLARGMSRQREIAIRLAIGAGRARLIRQLLTESVVLALPGAAAGLVVSRESIRWGERFILATLPSGYLEFVHMIPLEPDARVFCFILAAAVAAALLFGLAPAIQSTRANILQAAKGEFTTDFRPARLRDGLVIGQIAVSVLFLIFAAVLFRANHELRAVDVGLRSAGVIELNIEDHYRDRILQRLAGEPAIQTIAAASKVPFGGYLPRVSVVQGDAAGFPAGYLYASPEYFEMFRLPLMRGRNFTQQEAASAAPLAILSQATAARLFPGRDPLGQSLQLERKTRRRSSLADPKAGPPPYPSVTIIGIARDAVNGWVADGQDYTCVYFPTIVSRPGNVLFARAGGDVEAARRKLDAALDAAIPGAVDQIHAMDEILAIQLYPFRGLYWASCALGMLALVLTLSGTYGVLSYVTAQRTREIGIRVALGARPTAVAGLVLKQSLRFALTGAAIGVLGAAGVVRLVAAEIDMRTFDPFDGLAFGMGVLLAIAASTAAAWLPSRRAANIEPLSTLRCD